MKVFEIVEKNGAIIYANSELEFFITWNGSATFQWFKSKHYAGIFFEAVDIRTAYGIETLAQAEAEVKEWVEYELAMADHHDFSNINR
jgi:hypothetical protein